MGRLFGTDGVRGLVGVDLTEDLASRLGRAAVVALTEHGERRPRVAVGRDTRESGRALEAALVDGIRSAGGDALLLGVCTSPGVAFLTTSLEAQAGAVISASHNPAEYNGIKFFGSNGYKLADDLEDEIEALVWRESEAVAARGPGAAHEVGDAGESYLDHLAGTARTSLHGMRVVVDCANGAASRIGPDLLRRLGAEVASINDQPDGRNINAGGGATSPDTVAKAVVELDADAGVAFDGDADRAMFADHSGRVVDGDHVLAASALDLRVRGELEGDLVVSTVMANLGFRIAMREAGIDVLETRVGDRYVLEEMLRSGAVLGGEQSGHVIFLRHATTGDGLLTAVQFLTLARRNGQSVAELAACMEKYPQVLHNVRVPEVDGLAGAAAVWDAVRASEAALGEHGRVLVRASGTEPLVRVMVEARSEEEAESHAEAIAAVVRATLG